ncbi:cyclin-J18 isoform X1 [Alnus glutinosa]|uniref:cyclin-J18 isoform X1 n=1 Tax=Alnus glutinosa TaxID=3517 RepID=UPI002D79B9CC|nr:cyclin-J18 isoform X1 [Alnus glutinosa]
MNYQLPASSFHSTDMRLRLIQFLMRSTQELEVSPNVKYAALSFFADRFYPSLSRLAQGDDTANWLLQPIRESNLQLFALISLWISSKIHDSRPLSVKSLKSLGDKTIKEQHFTTRDFLEAELVLLQVLDFEIGTGNNAFIFFQELYIHFKGVAKVGEVLDFEACMDIMDLLYEKDETSICYSPPCSLAASILVASYVITVPKQRWEFPVLPWVKFVTSCDEEDIIEIVRDILNHVFRPSSLSQGI